MSEEAAEESPGRPAEAPGPPAAYWTLTTAVIADHNRRTRRATLIPIGVALLAVFALGASFLPDQLTRDLLVGYLVFLAVYGIVLALALLRVTGGPYGAAVSVAQISRNGSLRIREEATGDATAPATPAEAAAWLEDHPESEGTYPHRMSAQLLAGDLAGARESLARYPRTTPFERYWYEADRWYLDVIEGRPADIAAVEAEAAEITDPAQRAHGESGLAVLRAYAAAAAGHDWIPPLAAVHDRVGAFADHSWRVPMVTRLWTIYMVITAGLIGIAMLIARVTGVWR